MNSIDLSSSSKSIKIDTEEYAKHPQHYPHEDPNNNIQMQIKKH
jgi:hypothetical protein